MMNSRIVRVIFELPLYLHDYWTYPMDNYTYQKPVTDVHSSYYNCTADTWHSTWATWQKHGWTVSSCMGMHGHARSSHGHAMAKVLCLSTATS